jgi:HK97 family phage prohead protease
MDKVRSCTDPVQIRSEGGSQTISGYAAVFYDGTAATEYPIETNLVERISRDAFDRPLAEKQRVEVRFNHNRDFPLGSTEDNATVKVDDRGLHYSVPFDSTDPDHMKVRSKIDKSQVKGSSFRFDSEKYRFTEEGTKHVAWLTVGRLEDVGPVTSPAYKATTAKVRDEQYAEWLAERLETDRRIQHLAQIQSEMTK